ncbi:MAG: hypothetical protein Q8R14_00820 [Candidatus Omnitrophota bacterium]|nr:hypothetical protein [Candidatus Omnitrophota bacterium]
MLIGEVWAARSSSGLTSVGLDSAGSPSPLKDLSASTFTLPRELGTIQESNEVPGSDKTVIHIQDAHCNYAAQTAISGILDYVTTEYGVSAVNCEGGAESYDLSPFTDIPEKGIRKKTADFFVREGVVSAAEYYAVNNPEKVKLWGVEDADLYIKDLKIYRDSLSHKDEIDRYLKSIGYMLDNLKRHIYPEDLSELDSYYTRYKDDKIGFKEYITYLLMAAGKRLIDVKSYSNIYLLSQTLDQEDKINFKKANNEKDEVVDKLKKVLSKNELKELITKVGELKIERISQADFYAYLVKKTKSIKLDLNGYSELQKYIIYISLYSAIDRTKIMQEMESLEDKIKDTLYENDTQRELGILSKNLAIEKNFFNISLTREDYTYYKERASSFAVSNYVKFIDARAPLYKIRSTLDSNIGMLDVYREKMEGFYECSLERDKAFIKNIKFTDHGRPSSIIITGGFHTQNLRELFNKEKVSYVSIMPKFTNPPGYKSPYMKRLAGQRTALENVIDTAIPAVLNLQVVEILSRLGPMVEGKFNMAQFKLAVMIVAALMEGKEFVVKISVKGSPKDEGQEEDKVVIFSRGEGADAVTSVMKSGAEATPYLANVGAIITDFSSTSFAFSLPSQAGAVKVALTSPTGGVTSHAQTGTRASAPVRRSPSGQDTFTGEGGSAAAEFRDWVSNMPQELMVSKINFIKHLDKLVSGLSDPYGHMRSGSALAIKSLIDSGLISREDIDVKPLLDKLVSGLSDSDGYMRLQSASAIKSLIDSGLISREDIARIYYKDFNKGFQRIYDEPLEPRFFYYYMRLLSLLNKKTDAAYRIIDYLDDGLLELSRFSSEDSISEFFFDKLSGLIRDNISPDRAAAILTEAILDYLTDRIDGSGEENHAAFSSALGRLIVMSRKTGFTVAPDKIRDAIRLFNIGFMDGGNSPTNASLIAEEMVLSSPALNLNNPPLAPPEFKPTKVSALKEAAFPDINELIKKCEFYAIMGRTVIYEKKGGGFIALKLLKHQEILLPNGAIHREDEDPGKLILESEFFDYMNALKDSGANIRGYYPLSCPISGQRVVRINKDALGAALKGYIHEISKQSSKPDQKFEASLQDNRYVVMAYTIDDPGYITYLHQASDEAIDEASLRNIHDLFTLAGYGTIHPDIIELFHNLIQIGRGDRGRYLLMVDIIRPMRTRTGAGRLHAWENAVQYPNYRLSSPGDFAEMCGLDTLVSLESPNSIYMRDNLQRFHENDRRKFLSVHFMSNYLLGWVLDEGKRCKRLGELKWNDKPSMEKLADRIRRVYQEAYFAYTGKEDADIKDLVDWRMFARQMAFFMTDAYVKPLTNRSIPEGIFPKDTGIAYPYNITSSRGWTKDGWKSDGENSDLGPVNGPIPLQEMVKANYLYTAFMMLDGPAPSRRASASGAAEEKIVSQSPNYGDANLSMQAINGSLRRGAWMLDIAPALSEDGMQPYPDSRRYDEQMLDKTGHNIRTERYLAKGKWIEELKEKVARHMDEFIKEVALASSARMVIRLTTDDKGTEKTDIENLIKEYLKKTYTEDKADQIFNKHVKFVPVSFAGVTNTNAPIDLYVDIGMMEIDRYLNDDYPGEILPAELKDNFVTLLRLSITNFDAFKTDDVKSILDKIFKMVVTLEIRPINWSTVDQWRKANQALLQSV